MGIRTKELIAAQAATGLPWPAIRSMGIARCTSCGHGGEVREIHTHVAGTGPVRVGYCQRCGGSVG